MGFTVRGFGELGVGVVLGKGGGGRGGVREDGLCSCTSSILTVRPHF